MKHYKKAVEYLESSNYRQALPLLEEALKHEEIQPRIAEYSIGLCCLETGEYKKGARHFKRALSFKPDDWDACHGYARCMIHLKQYPAGKDLLSAAFDRGCVDLNCHNDMGVLNFLSGAYEEAEYWFEIAHNMDRQNRDVLINLRDTCEVLGKKSRAAHLGELLEKRNQKKAGNI